MAKLKPNQFLMDGHVITERPILYQTEMVKANLEDRKTKTRRIVKDEFLREWLAAFPLSKNLLNKHCPYGKPGDLLWVRETHCEWMGMYQYRADTNDDDAIARWKPSIHMPKEASRIWVMIEDIRVERVLDITEEDAKAEGIEPTKKDSKTGLQYYKHYKYAVLSTPIQSFKSLWISINGEDSWNSNPWVWVIKYRILSKTRRPSDEVISYHLKEILPTSHFPLPTP